MRFVNDLFVAVGDQGRVFASRDGEHWSEREAWGWWNPTTRTSITYGNGVYLVVGEKGTVIQSKDTLTWTPSFYVPLAEALLDVAYDDGMFVAIGNRGTLLTSADGLTWTVNKVETAVDLHAVISVNGQFWAVGNGGTVLTSGIVPNTGDKPAQTLEWDVTGAPGVQEELLSVTYGGGQWVAVGLWGRPLCGGRHAWRHFHVFGRQEMDVDDLSPRRAPHTTDFYGPDL